MRAAWTRPCSSGFRRCFAAASPPGDAALLEPERFGGRVTVEEEVTFLKRKLARPAQHSEIADWLRRTFPDRIVLHPRAVDLLSDRAAQSVSVALICDALDFLATDYWQSRYRRLPEAELLTRCSEKYGRLLSWGRNIALIR